MAKDDLRAGHETLKQQVEILWREHQALEREPFDVVRHEEHLRKLGVKKAELRAHRERLKRARERTPPTDLRFDQAQQVRLSGMPLWPTSKLTWVAYERQLEDPGVAISPVCVSGYPIVGNEAAVYDSSSVVLLGRLSLP